MKKLALFIVFTLFGIASVCAQSMSDDQVVEYVKSRNASGSSQQQIAKELLMKGVTQEQLMRVKAKYENNGQATSAATATGINRERVNNGEVIAQDPALFDDIVLDSIPQKKIFGHDIFRSGNLTFEPNMNIATPATYVLGPGDEVILDIYGASQYNAGFKVSPDGSITIPNEGPVNVAGLTVTQAQNRVRKAIGGHYQNSTIKVSVGQTRTILVNVMGEVKTPGTYSLSAFATVFNALYLAGGINELGTLRSIKVSRNGRIISTVDVYDYILSGRLAGNVMLQDNDVIIVGPYENLVQVEGKVKRPMFYEVKKDESLSALLSYAGGFTGDAYKQKVRVERKSDEGLTVHNVDEWDFTSFSNEDGDVVVVAPIIERFKNTAKVTGAVFRPGSYKITNSVNTVKTLVEQAGGLDEQAVTARAVLHRMNADRTIHTISIDLEGILDGKTPDVAIENEDHLIVASNASIYDSRTVTIDGEVFKPGKYQFSEKETIEDLIILAGGLKENATLKNVEVARRIIQADENTTKDEMSKIYTFDLSNGLSLAGQVGFELMPYDHVTIHPNPDYQEQQLVTISGEVNYAGTYAISNKNERLSDLITRAGGLTTRASAIDAKLVRTMNSEELARRRQLLEMAKSGTDSIDINVLDTDASYSVGINLAKAVEQPGCLEDVVLRKGDVITVPKVNNTVKINGEVLYPNVVTYAKGKGLSYYLNQAGGISKEGKKSQTYIIYANGQVSLAKNGDIMPGCEIVVPTKPEKKVDTSKVSMWATLASTVATVGAVISSIIR